MSALDTAAHALLLQLLFLIFALPVVTAVPAAITLHRQFTDLRDDRPVGVATYARDFADVWRRSWPLGIAGAALIGGLTVALVFWYEVATREWIGMVGLCAMAAVTGLVLTVYLGLLRSAAQLRTERWLDWCRAGYAHVSVHPGRGLVALVLLVAWLALVVRLPGLLIVGGALVPTLIAYYTLDPRVVRRDRESGSSAARP